MRPIPATLIVLMSLLSVVPSRSETGHTGDVNAIREVEQAMGEAMVAGDLATLHEIYADNFAAIGSDGKLFTKEAVLADVASSHDKLEWFENGPMDVQVFGDYALAQGFVKEKRSRNGQETTTQSFWQDLLEKHDARWVVWRSAGAKLPLTDQPDRQLHDPTAVAAIKKLENDLGNAMVACNLKRINEAYAEDWATITSTGEPFTKEGLLLDFRSGNHELKSFGNGPMNVQVIGDVALVQTSVTEKRIQDGKDISGLFIFMDLLKKRSGKWVIVRTLAARPA